MSPPTTPARTIRVPDNLWNAAKNRPPTERRTVVVELEGDEDVSKAIRKFLERYSR